MLPFAHWRTCHRYPRLSIRLASTASNQFPFPKQSNPTPHQIFHLPPNASQDDVKDRYYELVRVYHPDKADSSTSTEEAHVRFQAVTNAYNILRGKSTSNDPNAPIHQDHTQYATTAARRAMHLRRHRELYEEGAVDDRWKDRIIMFGIVGTIVAFVVQAVLTRKEALEEVMDRSRQLSRMDAGRRRKTLEDPRLSAPDGHDDTKA